MKRSLLVTCVAAAFLIATGHETFAQRGGRGGGGGRVGGGGIGGGGAARPVGGAVGGYSASPSRTVTPSSTRSVVGPGGGTRTTGSGSGSYTTQRGGTIDYAGAGTRGTTGGGVNYGKGVGGVQVTTAGGKEVSRVGTAGGAAGPGGYAVGSRSGVTVGSGPGGGSLGSAYHGGVAVGPHGAAATGGRVGTATGPGGATISGGTRGAVASGPYGAAAARGGVAVGPGGAVVGGAGAARGAYGTYYRSAAAVTNHGYTVRQNFRSFAYENPLLTARWLGPTWRPITWAALSGYCGYTSYVSEPVYYDYGESVVYQGDTVYVNGESVGTPEQYQQQATEIANVGVEAKPVPKEGEWQPLGVFAMVAEGEERATNIFQLAINKEGVISGEYYNALTDETSPLYGSVDKKTQRAAWMVGEKKFPVYEAGIANLTKEETTMLVHFSKEKSQQFTLVRLPEPQGEKQPEKK